MMANITQNRDSIISTIEEGLIHPMTARSAIPPNTPAIQENEIENLEYKICDQGTKMQCRIIRWKVDGNVVYELYQEINHSLRFLLLAYKKEHYYITNTKLGFKNANCCAKMKSNFLGTQFVIYDNGLSFKSKKNKINPNQLRQELGCILYKPNILGLKGPRKMTILLNAIDKEGKATSTRPKKNMESMIEKYKKNDPDVVGVRNKEPQWNSETESFVLNFHGRVTLPSIKNFQIVHGGDLDYIVLQFGKIASNVFTLDFQFPLSPIQAFAIALSSFDDKLACE